MLSKGGKIVYSCPNCRNKEIGKIIIYGQCSWECLKCGRFGPWRGRYKEKKNA